MVRTHVIHSPVAVANAIELSLHVRHRAKHHMWIFLLSLFSAWGGHSNSCCVETGNRHRQIMPLIQSPELGRDGTGIGESQAEDSQVTSQARLSTDPPTPSQRKAGLHPSQEDTEIQCPFHSSLGLFPEQDDSRCYQALSRQLWSDPGCYGEDGAGEGQGHQK